MKLGIVADHLVTADGRVRSPGWLVAESGRIAAVGAGEPPAGAACRALPRGTAVIPGFVDAHAHLALGHLRGVADDRPFLDWVHRGLLPEVEASREDPKQFRLGAERSVDELLRGGVTCVGDNFFRIEGARALQARGLRGVHFHEVFGSMAPDEDAYWSATTPELDSLPEALGGFPFGYSPHTPWTCPKRTFERVVARARSEGRRLSFHLAESVEEQAMFADKRGSLFDAYARLGRLDRYALGATPAAALAALGALGPATALAHCVQLTDDDVGVIAASGAHVVHCPTSNGKLAEGVAPIAKLLAAGVNVALGTDSAASNARLDMFDEMRAALLTGRAALKSIGPFTAATALRMATINGARALGLDDVGDLRPGAAADFTAVDLSSPRIGPLRNVTDAIVWSCDARDVIEVFVGGESRHLRGDRA